jgi:hypothetical protein
MQLISGTRSCLDALCVSNISINCGANEEKTKTGHIKKKTWRKRYIASFIIYAGIGIPEDFQNSYSTVDAVSASAIAVT